MMDFKSVLWHTMEIFAASETIEIGAGTEHFDWA